MAKKRPPMKLVWAEACQRWIVHKAELPKSVGVGTALAIVLTLLLSAASDGTRVLASARWVGRQTGAHPTRIALVLRLLVEGGWLVEDGMDRTTQAKRYRLTIPTSTTESVASSAATSHAPGEDTPSSLSNPQGEDTPSSFSPPRVRTRVRTPGHIPPTSEEVEESGASAPLTSKDNGAAQVLTLSAIEMDRLRGVLEQVAANRPAIDIHGFDVRNTDLQQKWHQLDQEGWDARKISLAIPRPKSVRSETGWLLSQLRGLPTDPDEDARVIEAQVLLLAWLSRRTNDEEEAAQYGISRVEYDHLIDQAEAHGYALEDGNWTEDGSRLKRQADDFQNSDDFQSSGDYYDSDDIYDSDDDPKWGLVHQALKVKSKSDVVYSAVEAES